MPPLRQPKASCRPSGDQAKSGEYEDVSIRFATGCSRLPPGAISQRSIGALRSVLLSDAKAIQRPSGDQAGGVVESTMGADVSVRLRAPFASIKSSRGMLVESPMKSIRRPSGEKLGYSAPPL